MFVTLKSVANNLLAITETCRQYKCSQTFVTNIDKALSPLAVNGSFQTYRHQLECIDLSARCSILHFVRAISNLNLHVSFMGHESQHNLRSITDSTRGSNTWSADKIKAKIKKRSDNFVTAKLCRFNISFNRQHRQ